MYKKRRTTQYFLDKELKGIKGLGGIWSRVDFRKFHLTRTRIKMINGLFLAGRCIQRPAAGICRRRLAILLSDGEKIPVTVYGPKGIGENAPCLLYYHGGAFVLRERPAAHRLAQAYAMQAGCKVVMIHYRPGLPYPEPVKDCYRGLLWTAGNAERLGIDKDRIAVLGDSAGGALAASVTLMARDKNGPRICFQMLIGPATDAAMTSWSMRQFVDLPGLDAHLNHQMWNNYLKGSGVGKKGYASPMNAGSLRGLPPAYIETLELDCLRDEGNAYADRLTRDGVAVELNAVRGTFNGYDVHDKNKLVQRSLKRRCMVLQKAFSCEKAKRMPEDGISAVGPS